MSSTLKTENLFKKKLMVAHMHIEYSTCQFFRRMEGGDGIHPPPWSLRYQKKRCPERVKRKERDYPA